MATLLHTHRAVHTPKARSSVQHGSVDEHSSVVPVAAATQAQCAAPSPAKEPAGQETRHLPQHRVLQQAHRELRGVAEVHAVRAIVADPRRENRFSGRHRAGFQSGLSNGAGLLSKPVDRRNFTSNLPDRSFRTREATGSRICCFHRPFFCKLSCLCLSSAENWNSFTRGAGGS